MTIREIKRLYSSLLRVYCHSKKDSRKTQQFRTAIESLIIAFEEGSSDNPFSAVSMSFGTTEICIDNFKLPENTILAILLFHAYGVVKKKVFEDAFGKPVLDILTTMQSLEDFVNKTDLNDPASNRRNLAIMGMAGNVHLLIAKISELIYIMRCSGPNERRKQLKAIERRIKVYVPLMDILGLSNLKAEIEDRYFELSSENLFRIEKENHPAVPYKDYFFLSQIGAKIRDRFAISLPGVKFKFYYTFKSLYSLSESYSQAGISDKNDDAHSEIYTIRIVVDANIKDEKEFCWKIYSIIADNYIPSPENFRDWISMPRSDGYEALHTTVFVDEVRGTREVRWVQFQICSIRMERQHLIRQLGEFRNAPAWFYSWYYSKEQKFFKNFSNYRFSKWKGNDEVIMTYTPGGEQIVLRSGSTVMDFAYKVHSDFLREIVGANVHGKMQSTDLILRDGDVVEIILAKNSTRALKDLSLINSENGRQSLMKVFRNIHLKEYYYSFISKALIDGRFLQAKKRFDEIHPFLSNDDDINRQFSLFFSPDFFHYRTWFANLWKILGVNVEPGFKQSVLTGRADKKPAFVHSEEKKKYELGVSEGENTISPEKKGELLEDSVMKLFRLFFSFDEGDTKMILEELRKQRRGNQFGFDITFKCGGGNSEPLRCLVECKNYSSQIGLEQIAHKLLEADTYEDITHWILISPKADISNGLHKYLNNFEFRSKFSFDIQIWTPETGVANFFGLVPEVYDAFYKENVGHSHPRNWTPAYWQSRYEYFRNLLSKPAKLPISFKKYINSPDLLLFGTESKELFEELYNDHVPLKCKYEEGSAELISLDKAVTIWLNDSKTESNFILLGEFGDGKSAFTYLFSRNLIENFKNNVFDGWLPIRFSLRSLAVRHNVQVREFVKSRLDEIGVDYKDWVDVKNKYKMVIFLDGVDEMSNEMDTQSLINNIKIVFRLLNEEFVKLKVVITSRKHFFENRQCKRILLDRLKSPVIVHISPIERIVAHDYLKKNASKINQLKRFQIIENSHDPIGLAAKPLYLQMIKNTLKNISLESFDEVSLYEDYIEQTLFEKIELLEKNFNLSREELVTNIKIILEEVAVALQKNDASYVLLNEIQTTQDKELVYMLWDSIEDNPEDGASRIAFRLILSVAALPDGIASGNSWPVVFCHRSLQEYFIARRIARYSLSNENERLFDLFKSIAINKEIASFVSKIFRRNEALINLKCFRLMLRRCAHSEINLAGPEKIFVSNNCVRILSMITDRLPWSDWAGLVLDKADFTNADFSHKDFSFSSLRGCNLENVDFQNADFQNTDLIDAMLEETAEVCDIGISLSGNNLIAIYGDGKIRQWDVRSQNYVSPAIVSNGHEPNSKIFNGPRIFVLVSKSRIVYLSDNDRKSVVRSEHSNVSQYKVHDLNKRFFLYEMGGETSKRTIIFLDMGLKKTLLNLEISLSICKIVSHSCLLVVRDCGLVELFDFATISPEYWREDSIAKTKIKVTSSEITVVDVLRRKIKSREFVQIAVGDILGNIVIILVERIGLAWNVRYIKGIPCPVVDVTCLKILDEASIVVGTKNGKIIKFEWEEASQCFEMTRTYLLEIKCEGMKIEGMAGAKEYDFFTRRIGRG